MVIPECGRALDAMVAMVERAAEEEQSRGKEGASMKEIEGKIENATRELKDKVIPSSISAQTAQTMDLKTLPLQYEIKGVKVGVPAVDCYVPLFLGWVESKCRDTNIAGGD